MVPGIPCGGEKASWDANFRVCQCDQPVLEANEDSKVRECWASGTVAVQLKTGKKGKLQVKHGSVLAAAAGAGALPGPRVARSQGTAVLHAGVMGASNWVWRLLLGVAGEGKQLCVQTMRGWELKAALSNFSGLGETWSALLLGEKAAETAVSWFLPQGREGLVPWGLLRQPPPCASCFAELIVFTTWGSSA